ncbi:MAG: cysteine desulfurase [Cyclobacteriaceae bacterium]|nr:cysteine desulfurase [Cyclobacteriaceae bacterium]MCH8515836.1 cysteine desulfurase [Cyclobacteriaceae bacterium]
MEDTSTLILDIDKIRKDFPVLHQQVNGKPLIYFDNAASTQKPSSVISVIKSYYENDNANIHRGIHTLAERATEAFEASRKTVRDFLGAAYEEEIIFTKGTTESINLVASSYGRNFLDPGDEIMISAMEHHANIVPWQMLCEEKGLKLRVINVTEEGEIDLADFEQQLNPRTKIVSLVHVSNTLGTINPIKHIIDASKKQGAVTLIDGAQAVSHLEIDVQELGCDFYVFSAHKIYGPTGAGVLYGRKELLEKMPPYQGGGEMIDEVSFEKTTYNELPYKFEAGTPNIADVIAMKTAIDYINKLGKKNIAAYEDELLKYATEKVSKLDKVTIIGKAKNKVSVLSFVVAGMHHFDIGLMMDARGLAVRTGHHCTQPLMKHFGLEGTARASFAFYNTKEEIDVFVDSLTKITQLAK